eukprot:957377-Pyramimonas_sp.AAC.1
MNGERKQISGGLWNIFSAGPKPPLRIRSGLRRAYQTSADSVVSIATGLAGEAAITPCIQYTEL